MERETTVIREDKRMMEQMYKENQMRPTELLESISQCGNNSHPAKEKNKVAFCPFCGKALSHKTATLYDAKHMRISQCEIAWCCRQEPLVIIE